MLPPYTITKSLFTYKLSVYSGYHVDPAGTKIGACVTHPYILYQLTDTLNPCQSIIRALIYFGVVPVCWRVYLQSQQLECRE